MPIDAFAQHDWHLHRNWCHPPPHILDKLTDFLSCFKPIPSCVVFTPYWPAHTWFTGLLDLADWALRVPRDIPPVSSTPPFDFVLFAIQTPLRHWPPGLRWIRVPKQLP